MKNKYKFILVGLILISLIVSVGAASADDLDTIQEGEVSGGVDVVASNPGAESGELSYDIPEDVKDVQYAGLYVDCYTAGSSNLVYGSEANITMTSNGESEQIASERLVATEGSQDGTVYNINDHTTKCYADYYMTYNLTSKLQNANGKITFNVNTGAIDGYEFYNKIKLIGLVFAYNDGDNDKIDYWVNSGSSWIKGDSGQTSKSTFNVGTIENKILNATIDNFALSSVDGIYTLNADDLIESEIYDEGVYYYKYHKWDVLGKITNGTNTLVYTPGAGSFSFRNVLSVLTLNKEYTPSAKASLASEYSGACFAGTDNVLKLNLTNDGDSKSVYVVDFYVDGVKVSSSEIELDAGAQDISYLIDDTIRPVTADTVNGVSTTKVNYTVQVLDLDGTLLDEVTVTPTLWYNGNLGKDLAYPPENITSFNNITVNGDIIIDTKGDSTYLASNTTGRTDVWNINVPDDANFVNGFVYVAYNWDKTQANMPVWTTTFNGAAITPVASYRDQSNMGTYGKYGYGLIVYDVTGLLNKGENTFVLEKVFNMTAVYPSTLVALYNVTDSTTIKTIYMYNGADLLSNANNFLGRTVASNAVLDVNTRDDIIGADLYVFAASAQNGEGDLIVNGETFTNVWSGSSNSVKDYIVDLTGSLGESNTVSFVATGSTIVALEQFVIVESIAYTDIYVSPDGTGTGASADDPTTLVKALNATTLQPFTKIHVLDGIYEATKNDLFAVRTNNTYIFAENPGNAILTGNDAYRIIRVYGSNVTIDGLVLTHGKGVGGTTYIDSDAKDVRIANCVFRDNNHTSNGGSLYLAGSNTTVEKCAFINSTGGGTTGGGSIYVNSAEDIVITDCIFENSTAVRDGGAIRVFKSANVKVLNSNFTNCIGSAGGAIAWNGDNGNVTNCIFTDNAANSSYTTYSSANHTAGAIYWIGTYGVIDHCTFINNTAPLTSNTLGGGAILLGNDGKSSNCTVMNSIFIGNSARNGGAIYWATSIEGRVLNCTFEDNKALNGTGGAIFWRGDKSHIVDSNFTNNHAKENGGAISVSSNVLNFLDIANCNFEQNSAENLNYTLYSAGDLYLDGNTIDSDYAIYNNGSITSTVYLFIVVNETDPVEHNVATVIVNDTVPISVYIVDDNLNTINGDGLSLDINGTVISEFEMDKDVYKASFKVPEWGNYFVNGTYTRANENALYTLTGTIVAGEALHSADVTLVSEYADACYAGTNNVVEVRLINNGALTTDYVVDFYVDGVKVDSSEITLPVGFSNILLVTDDTIRPVTANTAIGEDNVKVNYTVVVSEKESGDVLTEVTITPDILYNGNLGKDLAYPAENYTLFNEITYNGGLIIDTKDASTYSGASNPGRTDIWVLDLAEDAQLINGFIYVAYNWDKTNGTIPEFTCTFNDVSITPAAHYRDQSNLGKYGKYGYGLVVYDVSSLIRNGQNTFSLGKVRDLTAVYPSTLVAIYNVSKSDIVNTIYMYNGADLLSNSNNTAGRTVVSNTVLDIDSVDNLIAANMLIFAAGAQAGEGNLIVNDQTFTDIWEGTSQTMDEYDVNLGTNPLESNKVSFVATGSTILALEQFIILTYNVPVVDATLSTEYSNAAYAGTDNVLRLNLTNGGSLDTTYLVDFYVDGVKVDSKEIQLDSGAKTTTYLIDELIRPVTADTVNGVSTTKINYTVIISDKDTGAVLDEITLTPTLWYNGYLGKDLAYPAESLTSFNNITVNGDIIIDTQEYTTYLGTGTTGRTDVWTLTVPDDAQFVNGFLYVAYNWDKTQGTMPVWTTTFNNVAVSPVAHYRDCSNLGGASARYGYGVLVYDVTGLLAKGENTFVLEKESGLTAVYPSTLVALYNVTESETIKTVYMYNGADLLYNSYNFLGRAVESNSVLDIGSISNVIGANMYVFAAGAQAGEGNLIVNGQTYENIWAGNSNSTNLYVVDLGTSPETSNEVTFVSTGGTIVALQQFIVVESVLPSVSAKLGTEYNNAAFAGTYNALQLNLTNDGQGGSSYIIDFYVDGVKVDSKEIQLDSGAKTTTYLIDELIRPVTADTVNGVSTTKINYTVIISDKDTGAVLDEITLTPTLWYNGYLGKDLAYPAESLTSFNNITVNGDIIIDTQEYTTYLGTGTTGRTDVWTLTVPDDAQFVNGFLYVAYNWDKTQGTMPVWTTTFNNVAVSPVAHYRDCSNLGGASARYGYGVLVYDVTGLLAKGENTFVLEKESGLTAVYPSTLVALYNVTESETMKTIYMYNGADLLYNNYNFLGRAVESNSILGIDSINYVIDANMYVFAASAQANEGNLIVNDQTYENIWAGTSNSTDAYIVNLGTAPSSSYEVSFVSTGGTIVALQQFIVVESKAPKSAADLQKLIDEAEPGATIDLGTGVYEGISNVNITKDLTITGGTIIGAESAEAIFVIVPISEGGPNEVNITGVDFKVNNANTIVKATADNATADTAIDVAAISIKNNNIDLANDDVVGESVTVLELDSERPILAPTNEIAVSGNTIAAGINPFEFEVTSVVSGDDTVIPSGPITTERIETQIVYENMTTTAVDVDTDGRVGKYFYITLKDKNNNLLKNKPVQIGFNGQVYDRVTDENGSARLQINLKNAGTYTFAVSYLGDDEYNGSFIVAKIVVNKQKGSLTVPNKSYKASASSKTLTATFKSASGKVVANKKITFTVNGKSYSATTNAKGVATVKVSLNKKGTYSFTAKFAGNTMYAAMNKTAKLTIN